MEWQGAGHGPWREAEMERREREQQEAIDEMKARGLPIKNDNIDAVLGRAPQRKPVEPR